MPTVFPETLKTKIVTSTMTTITNRTDTTVTYSTSNSPHVNNSISSGGSLVKQESSPTTKYIQLQTVRPGGINTGMSASVPTTSTIVNNTLQGPGQSQQHSTLQSTGAGIPPGMVLTRNSTGQYVLLNGNQAPNNNLPQASSSAQLTTVTPVTRVMTTVATVTCATSITSVAKPATVLSAITTVAKTEVTVPPQATAPTIQLSKEDNLNVSKCRNFLTTLIKLASSGGQSPETVQNVKALVQNLIDDKISPEEFTKRLQVELNSSPQPYLVPFLEKSLPLLRLTMMQQSPGGHVPVSVAQAALRVSSIGGGAEQSKAPASPRPKTPAKAQKSSTKNLKNNIPEIRLPRVSMDSTLKHPSLQTPPPENQVVFQQPPHPSTVSGSRNLPGTPIRHPIGVPASRIQRWNAASSAGGSSFKDDEDINDVASMAGVNLSEESARILATNSELVGTQTRSCSDLPILNTAVLQRKMSSVASRNPHIQHIHADAVKLLACAAEWRLKDLLSKLSLVVCHRMVNYKEVDHYKAVDDVKTQLKFLQELDQIEKKKHEEAERDILMRAMKSRSKNDNPEHLRLKERAKEMQQQELEKMQIRNADETARNAIGPRKKKARLDSPHSSGGFLENHMGGPSRNPIRSRVKRVNLRDLIFVLEQERDACKAPALYKSYLK